MIGNIIRFLIAVYVFAAAFEITAKNQTAVILSLMIIILLLCILTFVMRYDNNG